MAQFSRCFITIDKKHFLNPATFGLVFVLQFFAGHAISTQKLFSAYIITTILFLVLGLITSFYARQLRISLSFILGYLLMGLLRLVLFNVPLVSILGIMITPTFYLFSFHMLSDPVTAPKNNNDKIYAGAIVALIDGIFRMAEIPYGQFYASLITGCIFALYLSNPKMKIVANENIQI
ncbi:MAG: RnfABCDGE type electron transport complex subunit D [Bacteriovorax sp.]|nr:RnfABCDGE type electron transport complex subunit D [Bacteriovorax sp.]